MMLTPIQRHSVITIRTKLPLSANISHCRGCPPSAVSIAFTGAVSCVPKARRNTIPATIMDVRAGMKNRDLKKADPLTSPECRSTAKSSGTIVSTITSQTA